MSDPRTVFAHACINTPGLYPPGNNIRDVVDQWCQTHPSGRREYKAGATHFPRTGHAHHSTALVTNHDANLYLRIALVDVARIARWYGWTHYFEALWKSSDWARFKAWWAERVAV